MNNYFPPKSFKKFKDLYKNIFKANIYHKNLIKISVTSL
jgi:hypothetical protein